MNTLLDIERQKQLDTLDELSHDDSRMATVYANQMKKVTNLENTLKQLNSTRSQREGGVTLPHLEEETKPGFMRSVGEFFLNRVEEAFGPLIIPTHGFQAAMSKDYQTNEFTSRFGEGITYSMSEMLNEFSRIYGSTQRFLGEPPPRPDLGAGMLNNLESLTGMSIEDPKYRSGVELALEIFADPLLVLGPVSGKMLGKALLKKADSFKTLSKTADYINVGGVSKIINKQDEASSLWFDIVKVAENDGIDRNTMDTVLSEIKGEKSLVRDEIALADKGSKEAAVNIQKTLDDPRVMNELADKYNAMLALENREKAAKIKTVYRDGVDDLVRIDENGTAHFNLEQLTSENIPDMIRRAKQLVYGKQLNNYMRGKKTSIDIPVGQIDESYKSGSKSLADLDEAIDNSLRELTDTEFHPKLSRNDKYTFVRVLDSAIGRATELAREAARFNDPYVMRAAIMQRELIEGIQKLISTGVRAKMSPGKKVLDTINQRVPGAHKVNSEAASIAAKSIRNRTKKSITKLREKPSKVTPKKFVPVSKRKKTVPTKSLAARRAASGLGEDVGGAGRVDIDNLDSFTWEGELYEEVGRKADPDLAVEPARRMNAIEEEATRIVKDPLDDAAMDTAREEVIKKHSHSAKPGETLEETAIRNLEDIANHDEAGKAVTGINADKKIQRTINTHMGATVTSAQGSKFLNNIKRFVSRADDKGDVPWFDQTDEANSVFKNTGHSPKVQKEIDDELRNVVSPSAKSKELPGLADVIHVMWLNSMLSGLKTFTTNAVGNTASIVAHTLSHVGALPWAAIRGARHGGAKGAGMEMLSEMLQMNAYIVNNVQSITDAAKLVMYIGNPKKHHLIHKDFKPVIKGLLYQEHMSFLDRFALTRSSDVVASTITNLFTKSSRLWGLPFEALGKADTMFRAVSYRGYMAEQAMKEAVKRANSVGEIKTLYKRLLDDPDFRRTKYAGGVRHGLETSYQEPIVGSLKLLQEASRQPYLRYIIPIVRTPVNLVKRGLQYSPLGFTKVFKDYAKGAVIDFKMLEGKAKGFRRIFQSIDSAITHGGDEAQLALARATTGSAFAAATYYMVDEGMITGGYEGDAEMGKMMQFEGRPPYSVLARGKWYSYEAIEPLRLVVGAMANYKTMSSQLDPTVEAERSMLSDIVLTYMAPLLKASTNSNYIRTFTNISRFINTVTNYNTSMKSSDPNAAQKAAERAVGGIAGTFMPFSGMMRQLNTSVLDDSFRDSETIMQELQKSIPGMSKYLPPHRNIWGDPIIIPDGFGPDMLSSIYTYPALEDRQSKELYRLRVSPSTRARDIGGVRLTTQQYSELGRIAGKGINNEFGYVPNAKELVGALMDSPEYQAMSDERKSYILKATLLRNMERARSHMKRRDPKLALLVREKQLTRKGLPANVR